MCPSTQRYSTCTSLYTILLHGLLIVQTYVAAYVSKLCGEIHSPHTQTHTDPVSPEPLNLRPSQIFISLIISLLMRMAIPTALPVFTMPLV